MLSSIKEQEMVSSILWLAKVYIRIDEPKKALDVYLKAAEKYPGELSFLLGAARIYDGLNDFPKALSFYKMVVLRLIVELTV